MEAQSIKRILKVLLGLVFILAPFEVFAQATAAKNALNLPGLAVNFGQGVDLVDTIEVLVLFTVITLAPAILILCTCFTRIIVVLSFMRQAIGTQNMPPNQLLIGFALFLSIFVMQPTGKEIYDKAIFPYMKDKKLLAQKFAYTINALPALVNSANPEALKFQQDYYRNFYHWNIIKGYWERFLNGIK